MKPAMTLTMQYRMDPDIVSGPNSFFYKGSLETAPSVLARPGYVSCCAHAFTRA
jgi:superfamily I DNA and/or RNA helicase